MRFFAAGFLSASLLWACVFYGHTQGWWGASSESQAQRATAPEAVPLRPRGNANDGRKGRKASGRTGTASVGDDIGWNEGQVVDMAGGEGGLSGSQIDAGFDSVMTRIRRCLVLVPAEGEITGQLTFGMRVGPNGKAKAVNLSGPAIVTGGESGACLRAAAQAIQFPKFDGPDAVFKYPVNLY